MFFKLGNAKIWCKIMHMKRNLYKRPRTHRGKYLNIDMHKQHSRGECHTHIVACTHTSIQYSRVDDSLPVKTPNTTHSSRRLESAYLRISMQTQPTYKCLRLCNSVTHGYAFHLSSFWNKCWDHSMFSDQYLLQSPISQHADLYLGSDGDRLHILRHCHGNNSICYSDQCQEAS